ncbi:MAG: clan AA aspartic protease [Candidatus Eremiobacteraeota bacterium]|nr:clan AA aspartic protease [Candidatus Eremiobacteraeota bacterium]
MRFAARILWLFVTAAVTFGAAPKPLPLDQLVERMRAASGNPYRYHVRSLAHSMVDGVQVEERTDTEGVRFVRRVCEGAICTGTYFDGAHLFTLNFNDTALPEWSPAERYMATARAIASGAFLDPAFASARGNSVVDLGMLPYDGKIYRALSVRAAPANAMVAFVDPSSSLVVAIQDWTSKHTIRDLDYRKTGPLMLPFRQVQDGEETQSYESRSIVTAPFPEPAGVTVAFEGPPVSLPIGKTTPVVDCTLGSILVRCLIDTGNPGTSISLELAEQLGLPSVGEFEVRGLGGYATEVVTAGPLRVGNAVFSRSNYLVLHDIHAYGYDVVLGADALAKTVLTIDYPARTLAFSPRDDAPDGIPLSFVNMIPVVPVRLGDLESVLAVDTGDESTVNLSFDYYSAHPDIFTPTGSEGVSGVGGNSEELIGNLPHLQIGEYHVESLHIGATEHLRATAAGHLGAGLLSRFRVTLDYARQLLHLVPRESDKLIRTTP